jgi:hypothetical protein
MIDRQVKDDTFVTLQKFVVLMYDHSTAQANVKATRQVLFVRNSNSLESIRSTEAVLKQHALSMQAEHQSGYV